MTAFAALIFSGHLGAYISRSIGLMLMGSVVVAIAIRSSSSDSHET